MFYKKRHELENGFGYKGSNLINSIYAVFYCDAPARHIFLSVINHIPVVIAVTDASSKESMKEQLLL